MSILFKTLCIKIFYYLLNKYKFKMKNIFDLYENGCCATPGNTTGMGNPMPAGENTIGSEPLTHTAKTKKEKSKKEVKEGILDDNAVSESILDDIDTNLEIGDDLLNFVNWYVGQYEIQYGDKVDSEKAKETLLKCTTVSKGIATIDINLIDDYVIKYFDADVFFITKDGMKNIPVHTIKYLNAEFGVQINSFVTDLSKLNVIAFENNGNIYTCIKCVISRTAKGNVIKFGKIECDKFDLVNETIDSVVFDKNSIIIGLNLLECPKLEDAYNVPHVDELKITKHFAVKQIKRTGLVPQSTDVTIKW